MVCTIKPKEERMFMSATSEFAEAEPAYLYKV